MKVSFDASGFTQEVVRSSTVTSTARRKIWASIRVVSFNVEAGIKRRMPVRTGRARASWGHSTPPAGTEEGIWVENENGLYIVQGSRVDYIQYLNDGSSQQAPAGFIDAEQKRGETMLGNLIIDDVIEAFT